MKSSGIRRFATTVAGVAAFAMLASACGNDGASSSTGGKVTLKYSTWFPTDATLKKTIAAFEAANPNIKVDLQLSTNSDYQKKLPLALNSGQKLDLVGVQTSAMAEQLHAKLTPIADLGIGDEVLNQLAPKALDQSRKLVKDGKLYFIPMGRLGSAAMFYNKDMLDRAGVTTVPRTMAELKEAVTKVKATAPDSIPVVMAGDSWFQDEVALTVAGQTTPTLFNDIRYGKGRWDNEAYVGALRDYAGLYKDGTLSKDTLDLTGTRATELFASGKSAFYVGGTWDAGMLSPGYRSANKIDIKDVGAAALPVLNPTATPSLRGFIETGLAVPKNSKHPKEAAELLKFLTVGDGVSVWGADLGLFPSKKDFALAPDVLSTETAKTGYTALQQLVDSSVGERNNMSDFTVVAGDTVKKVIQGSDPSSEAKKLQEEFTSGRYSK
ncbi:ABC transporter substrate-binding protein [Embleya scabrispora]|uniref:ABC transporter substrate-binding protein n=1 Tax=Embleya scabrispora TaxID=159449 RepID=UPI00036019CB|nr:extracellular solute-binding protein [Embleya scabrispora]MYS85375.1 extracellular solute-binding protein [Streptomyces sp. SID5474]